MASVTLGSVKSFRATTVTGSGFATATTYVLTITDPGGGTAHPEITTDGSGAFTFSYTPQGEGPLTISVRPKAEHTGTTTAAATVSVTVGHGEAR